MKTRKKKQKPLSRLAKARNARRRRDPGWRVSLEIARYLKTVGWVAVVSGPMQVRGFEKPGLQRYEFVMEFTGGRLKPPPAADAVATSPQTSEG